LTANRPNRLLRRSKNSVAANGFVLHCPNKKKNVGDEIHAERLRISRVYPTPIACNAFSEPLSS
jgi:hypothetical protein